MAPRGRHRKRLTRMDAAFDAMSPLGFPEELVCRRVKDLLKEYGGDEGWPFIEADAYKLLIETILDEQEEVEPENHNRKDNLLDMPLRDDNAGDYSVADDAGPSRPPLPPTYSEVPDDGAQPSETEGRPAGGDGRGWKDIVLDQTTKEKDTASDIAENETSSQRGIQLHYTPLQSPPPISNPSPLPSRDRPIRKRKPCYGWIDDDHEDDDGEDDLIQLTPAIRLAPSKAQGQQDNRKNATENRRKRKIRWDVMPEDM